MSPRRVGLILLCALSLLVCVWIVLRVPLADSPPTGTAPEPHKKPAPPRTAPSRGELPPKRLVPLDEAGAASLFTTAQPGDTVVRRLDSGGSPARGPRFISLMLLNIDDPSENGPDASGDFTPETPPPHEPSDLDGNQELFQGTPWAARGFGSLLDVVHAAGLEPQAVWIDSAEGELLISQRDAQGRERMLLLSPEPTPGDLDGDDRATALDLCAFLKRMNDRVPDADVNEDGRIDAADLQIYLREWSNGAQ